MTYVESTGLPVNIDLGNFLGIQNEVLNFGFNDGPQVNRGRVKGWINEGLFQIAREVEAPELQTTETIALEHAVWKYSLPEDFLRMQDVFYPERQGRLRPIDLQQFDLISGIEGPPSSYTLYGTQLWLFPTPNVTGETLELRYMANPPALVNDTDIPVLNPNYWHLLVQYAVGRAFEAEDDPESAQAHIGRYQRDLAAFATDVQYRSVDRPRVLDGTWGGGYAGGVY